MSARAIKRRYLRLIAEAFPQITYSQTSLTRRGWDNDVLILDDRLVFRFPKRAAYGERFKAEVRFLRAIGESLPVAVPNYLYLPRDLSFGGYPMVPGRPLRRSLFHRLNAPAQETIARALGRTLTILHAVPIATARELGISGGDGDYWESKPNSERRYQALRQVLFPKLNRTERTWLDRQFCHYLSLSFDFPLKVIHNDLTDDHIFLAPQAKGLGGLIDFSDAEISDPAMDFAGLWLYGRAFVERVLHNYAHDVDDDFVERSKMPYRVHSAINMLAILQDEHSAIPQTYDSLRRQLNREMVLFRD